MLRFIQIDSFSLSPFSGNPAVIFEPTVPLEAPFMQAIAREMNVSETAFLSPDGDSYALRWFTPTAEVDLCGHATLAAAHALWSEWGEPNETIQFNTRSGRLVAWQSGDLIWLNFPSEPIESVSIPELQNALDAELIYAGMNRMDHFVELGSETEVRTLQPDFSAIARLGARGLIVTARADDHADYDFISRFFAPAYGLDEDPVTGSAHCALAPYWSQRIGRKELLGYQASPRGGFVRVRLDNDRVHLGGSAVTVFVGEMRVNWREPIL